MSAIFASDCLHCMVRAVQLTSGSPNFKKSIPKTTGYGMSAMRKVSSNHRVQPVLSLISKPAITIPFVLICCLLIVTKPHEVSKIFRGNYAAYPREIKLATLPKSIKAKTSSLPLFSLTFQVMHLTVINSWSTDVFSKSSLPSVIGAKGFPITAGFLAQDRRICYSSVLIFHIGNNCPYSGPTGWRGW